MWCGCGAERSAFGDARQANCGVMPWIVSSADVLVNISRQKLTRTKTESTPLIVMFQSGAHGKDCQLADGGC